MSGTKRITEVEYLDMDIHSEEMLEYLDGIVVVKERWNGINHSHISSALVGEIGNFLKGGEYETFFFNLRVAEPSGTAYMYPDLFITGSYIEKKKDCFDTLTNPLVVVEITSEITRERDALKFFHYRKIPSLREYILIDTTRYHITVASKNTDCSWQFTINEGLDALVTVTTISMELPLADIYRKVSFAESI